MNCPLHRDTPNTSRNTPSCQREAICYSMHDAVLMLLALANVASEQSDEAWNNGLNLLDVLVSTAKGLKGKPVTLAEYKKKPLPQLNNS